MTYAHPVGWEESVEEQSHREWRSLVAGPWLSCERSDCTELADPEGQARGALIRFGEPE